jgi:predicted N-acetyltransferase YhbS
MDSPVSITPDDHGELIDLLNLCFREDGGSMLDDYERHVGLCNQNNIRVIKDNGRIVSHIATSVRPVVMGGIPTKVAGVGAVATHPDARGKGLASLLMEDTVARSEEQGADLMLISNDLNLYRRHNARLCGSFPQIEIQINAIQPIGGFTVRRVEETDLDAVIKLRQSLATRYLLPREDLAFLFHKKIVMDKPSDWWLVEFEEKSIGFGTVHFDNNLITLHEWAGHPKALHHAAAFWLSHYPAKTFLFNAVDESQLPVDWKAFIKERIVFEGSVVVMNGKRLIERAQPFIEERIGEETFSQLKIESSKQQLYISYKNETVAFEHGGELAECLFGLPDRDMLAEKISPDGDLYPILSAFLPLPLVWYGIGYV